MTLKCTTLALALAFALAAPARADEFRRSVDVRPGGKLMVELPGGELVIETHDAASVEVEANSSGWARWHFELTSDGENARFTGSHTFWPLGGGVRARLRVPREYSLDLRTSGGSIEIESVRGSVKARTSGGSIELGGATGEVDLRTSGGSIRVDALHGDATLKTSGGSITGEGVAGKLDAETSGGSIRLAEIAGELRARTSGGPITARFVAPAAGELRTSGGGIEIELPPGTGAELEARASGGTVEIDSGLAFAGDRDSSRVRGRLGPGGERLDLQTSGGGIQIRVR